MHLLGTHLVGDGRKTLRAAEALDMRDQFHRALDDHANVDDLPLRDIDVHRGIDVNQVVTGLNGCLERLFDARHGILRRPAFDRLLVLEPRAAVVDGDDRRSREVDRLGLDAGQADELRGREARVAAVAVDLVERRGEIDRRVVALRRAECRADHRNGVGARGEDRPGNARFRFDACDLFE